MAAGVYVATALHVQHAGWINDRVERIKHVDVNNSNAKQLPAVWQDVSQVFTALGDPQRQRILLTFEPGERLNVTQLAEASTRSRPSVSHHLKILREAGCLP